MTCLELIRNKAFWLIDALRGGQIKSSLNEMKRINGGLVDEAVVASYQNASLSQLLQHAIQTVPRYRNMTSLSLQDWPISNKDSFRCDYEMSLSNSFKKEHLIKMTTSGSTGTPFTSYQDIRKKRHVNAEVLFYNGQTGFLIGRRIIYLRSVVAEVSKSRITQFAQNIYLLDCMDLSDRGIENLLASIREYTRYEGAMMMGYSSTLDAFRKYFEKHGLERAKECKIYGIVAGSEMLLDVTRKSVEQAFGCKCYSRYANEENGFLGQDGIENNVFLMNDAHYITEILKFDKDEPAEFGEVGRIVITDLFNYAMPMIRYDTGDVGAWTYVETDGRQRKAIGSFGGRIIDMVTDVNGNMISPHTITNMMWKYQNVLQFQLIQKDVNRYEIKLNVNDSFDEEKSLIDDYSKIFGEESIISIEYTQEIPVLASGKRRYVVNETLIRK